MGANTISGETAFDILRADFHPDIDSAIIEKKMYTEVIHNGKLEGSTQNIYISSYYITVSAMVCEKIILPPKSDLLEIKQ